MTVIPALKACLRNRSGAVAVEFAMLTLPMLLLVGGSVDIGRYVWTRLAVQDAASTGARCLGLRVAPCFDGETMNRDETRRIVREQARAWAIGVADAEIAPMERGVCDGVSDFSRVAIAHQFSFVLGVFPEAEISVQACFPVMPSE